MQKSPFPYKLILRIHRALLIKMLIMDIVLGITGFIFMILPQHIFALSIEKITLLLLTVILSLVYQIHLFRSYCGSASFYLCLPVKKVHILPLYAAGSIIPALIASILYLISRLLLLSINVNYSYAGMSLANRVYYLLILFSGLKILPLPLLILYKKHPALVPVFCMVIAAEYFIISILNEMVSNVVIIPSQVIAFCFYTSIALTCLKIHMDLK